jgi:hypothetical protein
VQPTAESISLVEFHVSNRRGTPSLERYVSCASFCATRFSLTVEGSCISAVCGSLSALGWAFLSEADTAEDTYERQDIRGILAGSMHDMWTIVERIHQEVDRSRAVYLSMVLFLFMLGVLMTPFFLLARVYIVGEAFASIRSVPAGAYANIQWTQYLPHL